MDNSNLPILKVVTGILRNPEGLYFVSLRPPHVPFGGMWEFPGGKIEIDETPYEALVRELQEEIGICVNAAEPLLQFQHAYSTRIIDISAWHITQYTGNPYGAEGQECDWVTKEVLADLTLPDATRRFIQHL